MAAYNFGMCWSLSEVREEGEEGELYWAKEERQGG
jgi:hypothetical protein